MLVKNTQVPLLYFLLTLLFRSSSTVFAQLCYFPSGIFAPTFTPCNGTASVSHCCQPDDACLTSGLCFRDGDHSIHIGACTDADWGDPNCFQSCPRTSGELMIKKNLGSETREKCKWCRFVAKIRCCSIIVKLIFFPFGLSSAIKPTEHLSPIRSIAATTITGAAPPEETSLPVATIRALKTCFLDSTGRRFPTARPGLQDLLSCPFQRCRRAFRQPRSWLRTVRLRAVRHRP